MGRHGRQLFFARQLIRTAAETVQMVVAMVALAVGLSALGYYQYFVEMPADRAAYASDPDTALRRAGEWYSPDSVDRKRFEDRLASTEPLATFALTNSLAGFLVPWLIVTVGLAAGAVGKQEPGRRLWHAWHAAVLAVVILGCLLLTKSRSGYVAAAVGAVGLYFISLRGRRLVTPRRLLAAGAVTGALIAGAVAMRALDREVITEAGKSLGYRWQYWRATADMIRARSLVWLRAGKLSGFLYRI